MKKVLRCLKTENCWHTERMILNPGIVWDSVLELSNLVHRQASGTGLDQRNYWYTSVNLHVCTTKMLITMLITLHSMLECMKIWDWDFHLTCASVSWTVYLCGQVWSRWHRLTLFHQSSSVCCFLLASANWNSQKRKTAWKPGIKI